MKPAAVKLRRTPALTAEARRLFIEELRYNGWQPGVTTAVIAEATDLTADQVRDAIFSPSADEWRHQVAVSQREAREPGQVARGEPAQGVRARG